MACDETESETSAGTDDAEDGRSTPRVSARVVCEKFVSRVRPKMATLRELMQNPYKNRKNTFARDGFWISRRMSLSFFFFLVCGTFYDFSGLLVYLSDAWLLRLGGERFVQDKKVENSLLN